MVASHAEIFLKLSVKCSLKIHLRIKLLIGNVKLYYEKIEKIESKRDNFGVQDTDLFDSKYDMTKSGP